MLVGGGPSSTDVQAMRDGSGPRRLRHLHRPRARTRRCSTVLSTADVCVNPDRANDDERQVHHEQDHGIHGARQTDRAVRSTEGRVSARDASLYAARNDPADFGDKIAELLDDPERRATMGAKGRGGCAMNSRGITRHRSFWRHTTLYSSRSMKVAKFTTRPHVAAEAGFSHHVRHYRIPRQIAPVACRKARCGHGPVGPSRS